VKKILVSLHDVTPVMFNRSRALVNLIWKKTGANFTILVIPDFHNRGRIDRFPEFSSWLRELNDEGVEIAQHGLYHIDGSKKYSLKGSIFTSGEGEFLHLSSEEAHDRIEQGYRILSDVLGEPPSGFTAPAWLYSGGTEDALKGFSFRWVEYRWSIQFSGGARPVIPAVVFAAGTMWKRFCSRFWATAGPAVFSGDRIYRLALHVRDLPALEKQVERALCSSTRGRSCIRCVELEQK
jgi:predicted deacetylase